MSKEQRRAYYLRHRQRLVAYQAAYRAKHKGQESMQKAAYYAEHKEERNAYQAGYYADNKEQERVRRAIYASAIKLEVLNAYGGARCACCGETLFEGLSIDHVDGNGAEHRRNNGAVSGGGFYRWLKKHGFPLGYQVLCATCNVAKGTGDHCPHEDLRIAWG